jgi:3'(2'), 5'-bisphosphate nucleotidase
MRLPVKRGYREKIWDHAAGVAVIEAAGGRVTDLNGKDLDFGCGEALDANRGVLASNGFLHDAVLAAVIATTPEGSRWE